MIWAQWMSGHRHHVRVWAFWKCHEVSVIRCADSIMSLIQPVSPLHIFLHNSKPYFSAFNMGVGLRGCVGSWISYPVYSSSKWPDQWFTTIFPHLRLAQLLLQRLCKHWHDAAMAKGCSLVFRLEQKIRKSPKHAPFDYHENEFSCIRHMIWRVLLLLKHLKTITNEGLFYLLFYL